MNINYNSFINKFFNFENVNIFFNYIVICDNQTL